MDFLSPALNQLSNLLADEAKLLGSLRQEIQSIVDELEHIEAFLMFAERREEEDPRLEVWISQVRDVAADIQAVVDDFTLRFVRRYGHGCFGQARRIWISMKNLRARHQIAQEIQAIKSRIASISQSHNRYRSEYGTPDSSSSSGAANNNNSWHCYRDEALLIEETKLVGIDQPKQQLITQLLDADSNLKVVSVMGMGGLGKTTLVRIVQQDENVKRQFKIHAWVTISQSFDMKELLKDLIRQLYQEIQKPVPQEVASIVSTYELKVHVKDFLQDKRYLIVFDDVWDTKFWDGIKLALPEGSCGNRVMLTTRIANVARASNVEFHSYVHQMQPLSFEDSWSLFCKKTFKDNSCPAHLENVARGILRKCQGLPLGINVIGGLLALKDKIKIDEWKMVEQSLGGEMKVDGKLVPITKILSLGYKELPYHLKNCLLYASIFPEDYQIDEQRLIRLWISEGFVSENGRMTKYEVALAYLAELTNRSLINQVEYGYADANSRVYLHDLLRVIVLSKSTSQNFATIATGSEQKMWPKKVRRLAIHEFNADMKERINDCKYLQSLVIFKAKVPLSKSLLSELLRSDPKLLKVLDLEGTELEEIPKVVFRLFQLRTLILKHTRVKVIPKSIGSLKKLEYLDLSFTEVIELPEEILKLERLVHLVIFNFHQDSNSLSYGFKCPGHIAKLVYLEWLYDVEANEILIREVGELKQLKRLGFTNLRREDGTQLCSSLGKLSSLKNLYLSAFTSNEVLDLKDMNTSVCSNLQNLQVLSLWGCLEKIPQLVPSLQELTRIELSYSRLVDDPLESLQHLPNLLTLRLEEAFEGESLCFKVGCFLKLKQLCLVRFGNLRWLRVEGGGMPDLGELRMDSLTLLEDFPWGIQHLSKLQSLYCINMNVNTINQLLQNRKEESENYKKINRIPKFMIWDAGRWIRYL